MTIVSYAPHFEDIMLWRALRSVKNGAYIDIGASDPVVGSVSLLFYEQGWRGVHVEPDFAMAEKLQAARPDEIVLQAAVTDIADGVTTFNQVTTREGYGTVDPNVKAGHMRQGLTFDSREVPTLTINQVFSQCPGPCVHWLKIDAEGMEAAILKKWTSPCRPWIVIVESIDPVTQDDNYDLWEQVLSDKGYFFVWSDRVNRFYLHADHSELKRYFSYSVSVLDPFVLHRSSSFCWYLAVENAQEKQQYESDRQRFETDIAALRIEQEEAHRNISDLRERNASVKAQKDRAESDFRKALGEVENRCATLSREHETLAVQLGRISENYGILSEAHRQTTQLNNALQNAAQEQIEARRQIDALLMERDGTLRELTRERENLSAELARISGQNAELQLAFQTTLSQRDAVKRQLDEIAAKHEDLSQRYGELESRRAEVATWHDALTLRYAELSASRATLEATLAEAEARVEASDALNRENAARNAELSERCSALEAKLAEEEARLEEAKTMQMESAARYAELSEQCSTLETKFADAEASLEMAKTTQMESAARYAEVQAEFQAEAARRELAERQLAALSGDFGRIGASLGEMEKERDALVAQNTGLSRQNNEKESELARHKIELQSALNRNRTLSEALDSTRQARAALFSEKYALTNKVQELSGEIDARGMRIDALLNSRSWRITKPLRSFMDGIRWCKRKTASIFGGGKTLPARGRTKPFSARSAVALKDFTKRHFPRLFNRLKYNGFVIKVYRRLNVNPALQNLNRFAAPPAVGHAVAVPVGGQGSLRSEARHETPPDTKLSRIGHAGEYWIIGPRVLDDAGKMAGASGANTPKRRKTRFARSESLERATARWNGGKRINGIHRQ